MVIVLMGVAGSGKTTIGRGLAAELDWQFHDADDFHPRANVEKMARGLPLDDDDRLPWLETLRDLITNCLERDENAVLACSALKESYRERLLCDERVELFYLKGDYRLIEERLKQRTEHFMKPAMLESQFAALEEPAQEARTLDVSASPDEIIQTIKRSIGISRG
jgi:gluconokinase